MKRFDHDEHVKETHFWNRNCVYIDTRNKQRWHVNPYPNIKSNDVIFVNNSDTDDDKNTRKKRFNIMRSIYKFLFS